MADKTYEVRFSIKRGSFAHTVMIQAPTPHHARDIIKAQFGPAVRIEICRVVPERREPEKQKSAKSYVREVREEGRPKKRGCLASIIRFILLIGILFIGLIFLASLKKG